MPDLRSVVLRWLASWDLALGDWANAERRLLRILPRTTRQDEEPPELGRVLNDLGRLYTAVGALPEAEVACRKSLRKLLRETPQDHLRLGRLYHTLGHLTRLRGLLGRAEASFHAAWKRWAALFGKSHPESARVANDLGTLYHENGRRTAARVLYEHVRGVLAEDPRQRFSRLGGCLNNLALLSLQEGDDERAAALLREYIGHLHTASCGRCEVSAARSLALLAGLESRLQHDAAARWLLQQAVTLCRESLGPWHPESAAALARLAGHYRDAGRPEEATKWLRQALQSCRRTLGPRHPQVAATLCDLAAARAAAGALDEARDLLRQAADIDERWPRRVAPESLRRSPHRAGLEERLERTLDLVRKYFSAEPEMVAWVSEQQLRRRSLLHRLKTTADRPLPLDGELRTLHLLQLQTDHRWLTGPGHEALGSHRRLLASWLRRWRRLRQTLGPQGSEPVLNKSAGRGVCRPRLE